jgi:hypothetical protein
VSTAQTGVQVIAALGILIDPLVDGFVADAQGWLTPKKSILDGHWSAAGANGPRSAVSA